MRTLIFLVLFCSIYILRFITLRSPLPETWTADSLVRFTAPIIDQVEHSDTKTIVRVGVWYISLTGYAAIIPGEIVRFSGTVEPQLLATKIVRIVMQDPIFEVVSKAEERSLSCSEWLLLGLLNLQERSVTLLENYLPDPMSSLAAGILLGVKSQLPSDFYASLVKTGTLHIVAASGYNVGIVAILIMSVVGRWFSRRVTILWGAGGILLYVLLSGSSASVVRAGVMGSLTLMAYYFGRPAEAVRLLWVSAGLMLLFDPLMLLDIGFQLSVSATAGLLYLEPWIRQQGTKIPVLLGEYLWPTLAASLATAPIILFHFGRIAWMTPLVNLFVLPLIPLIMGMSAIVVLLGLVDSSLGMILSWFLYIPLSFVVAVIRWFG